MILNNSEIHGLLGGSLIGLAAATLLLGCGEIMGASGIFSSLLMQPKITLEKIPEKWKILFFASFISSANLFMKTEYKAMEGTEVTNFAIFLAGICTGFGSKLSNGCTSGHGICGMARFSYRSIVAVLTFMCTGFTTASLLSKDVGIFRNSAATMQLPNKFTRTILLVAGVFLVFFCMKMFSNATYNTRSASAESNDMKIRQEIDFIKKAPFVILSGSLFAAGLNVSQMIDNKKVLNFLDVTGIIDGTWDPMLIFVMGSGVIISGLSYQYVEGYNVIKKSPERILSCSLSGSDFRIPKRTEVDAKLVIGAAFFGFGWALGGVCPGSAIYLASVGYPQMLYIYIPMFINGRLLVSQLLSSKIL